MEIARDSFVVIEYDVRLDDGTYIRGESAPASMNFIAGYCQVMPGLERRLLGMNEGSEASFTIPAGDAFGEHDKTLVKTLTFVEFPTGRTLQPGKWAAARNTETAAEYGYFVVEKTDSSVTLDYNHPLAGKPLHYRVKVVHVRPASKEELEFVRPCEHGEEEEADQKSEGDTGA